MLSWFGYMERMLEEIMTEHMYKQSWKDLGVEGDHDLCFMTRSVVSCQKKDSRDFSQKEESRDDMKGVMRAEEMEEVRKDCDIWHSIFSSDHYRNRAIRYG